MKLLTPGEQGQLDAEWSQRKAQVAFNPYDPWREETAYEKWETAYLVANGVQEDRWKTGWMDGLKKDANI